MSKHSAVIRLHATGYSIDQIADLLAERRITIKRLLRGQNHAHKSNRNTRGVRHNDKV